MNGIKHERKKQRYLGEMTKAFVQIKHLVWLGDSGVDPMASDHSFLGVMEDGVQSLGIHVVDWTIEQTSSNDEWNLTRTSTRADKEIPKLFSTRSVLVKEWKKFVLGWKANTEGEVGVRSSGESFARALSWFVSLEDLHKVLEGSSHGVADIAMDARSNSSTSVRISIHTSFWLSVDSDSGLKMDVVLFGSIESWSVNFNLSTRHSEALVSILSDFFVELNSGSFV